MFLFKKDALLDEISSLFKDKKYSLITGWLALILGLITVVLHNIWVAD